ncbi:unnamed protein product, partial [Ixodes hexagonus]
VNVKSTHKGTRLRDTLQEPIYRIDDTKLRFLNDLLKWLDTWKSMKCDTGGLTKETHAALEHTCMLFPHKAQPVLFGNTELQVYSLGEVSNRLPGGSFRKVQAA